MAAKFKDYFSGHAVAYSEARPRYPVELFDWLAGNSPNRELAWDCATGNGQAALGLAEYFDAVIATDASAQQIENAFSREHVSYRVAAAESPGLEPHTVDLVTVAQAVHWFDRPAFYAQVQRVLKPQGVIAVWCYGLCTVFPDMDTRLREFYVDEIGPYWPPERRLVDESYRTIEFPFEELPVPVFRMIQRWDLRRFLDYLSTWSAVQRCRMESGRDPVETFASVARRIWGNPVAMRTITWPIHIRAGHNVSRD